MTEQTHLSPRPSPHRRLSVRAVSAPTRRSFLSQLSELDSDRLLVLVLIVLLLQNGAATELILALVYIAMG